MAPPSARHSSKAEELRKATTFHPSLWGDFFLTYQPPTAPQQAYMKERAEVLREDVRKLVKGSTELPETLNLIITLQRLGVDYYYEDEIDKLLHDVYNSDYNDKDLNLVSLRFYLLRKNNYDVSSDVFLNFRTKEGEFADADTRSLLSLYNGAYLRRHGEKVLDDAISFTRHRLHGILEDSESPFAKEASSSLRTPLFRRVGILEARNYIPIYEKEAARNEAILEFAKLNFNIQQLVFCEELKHCTVWWKEFLAKSKMTFVRDRIVEVYFWMNGACYDPPYSHSRIILTKITSLVTIIDDMFDTYGTTEECMKFAEAINRTERSWNRSNDVRYRLRYLSAPPLRALSMKRLVQQYSKEVEWRDEDYVPETMSEHLQVSMESIGSVALACAAYVGMGDVITKETLEWVMSYPQFLTSFGIFVRLSNDLVSTKREQTADHSASSIHCYMKEHGTTMNDACEKIRELTEDSWKDMLEQCLALTELPKIVPRTVFEFSRTTDNMYKNCDAFTSSQELKEMIELLFVEPIPE
ncbi:Sesquithujene synthase A [Dichanthelium oligosanthes]|uniref:Sesquithujene synthase A n=1 Tax=Dichanthelium oligosanthes TaxID=888268 RepID=A0A1E5UQI6_9POAL|nr:Sesquithujene synthase A [Dichanthelium oligosanthes]